MFITLEGGEGCGKSTQIALLSDALSKAQIPHIKTREPGGSPGAERIRSLLVSGDKDRWDADTETLLFYAARLDHVQRVIQPALAEHKIVLCDRFVDSTRVYQGVGKQVPAAFIEALQQLTLGEFIPDITLILDIDPSIGLKRTSVRTGYETRFESMDLSFHQAVRNGFLNIAKHEPKRCVVIDASQSIDVVQAHIISTLQSRLGIVI
jgi:dTMP kinase